MTLRSDPSRTGLSSSRTPSPSPSSQPILLKVGCRKERRPSPDAFPGQGEKWVPSSMRDHLLGLALAAWAEEAGPPWVSQPELLAFLPEPKNWAEGQPFPCQGPADLPIREPGTQPREARGSDPTLSSWLAWASRSSTPPPFGPRATLKSVPSGAATHLVTFKESAADQMLPDTLH